MSTYTLIFAVACFVGLLWFMLQLKADNDRSKQFSLRSLHSFDDWYVKYYKGSEDTVTKRDAQIILESFGEVCGVEPTRLKPADRIEDELSLHGLTTLDDTWETVDALLSSTLGLSVEWSTSWKTLDDIIRGICVQAKSHREQPEAV